MKVVSETFVWVETEESQEQGLRYGCLLRITVTCTFVISP